MLVPVLPLRDVVVYPHMVIPLFVGRDKSIKALDHGMQAGKQILLVAQKSPEVDDPSDKDLNRVGTLSTILQLLKLPDGTVKVLVEGGDRAAYPADQRRPVFSALVTVLRQHSQYDEREADVLMRSALSLFDQYVKLNKKIPPEILTSLAGIDSPGRLADTIAAHMQLKLDEKQKILEIDDVRERLEHVMALIEGEIDVLQIEKRIRARQAADGEEPARVLPQRTDEGHPEGTG